MKTIIGIACCLLCLCFAGPTRPAPAQGEKSESEKFGARALIQSGAGAGANRSVDLYIRSYTSDEEAKVLGGMLLDGGPDVLLKALEKSESKGKITLTGRVGFYDLKLIRSRPTETGRQIYAVGDRPIGLLEAFYSGRSRDYEFGIIMLDLKRDSKGKEKGEGVLIYAAKVKVLEGNKLEIENYGISPIRLLAVRKL
jgi:hypothetical protein